MPVRRREMQRDVGYVVVKRALDRSESADAGFHLDTPTPALARRTELEAGYDSDSDDDYDDDISSATPSPSPTPARRPTGQSSVVTLTQARPSVSALADSNPTETIVVSFQPENGADARTGRISQTTEHLLIAAGSIGATIIIVMIVLAIYTMRKRGMTLSDLIRNSKDTVRRQGGRPPPPPSKYGLDRKQVYDDDYMYVGKALNAPRPAAAGSRSGSLSTQTPLQPLGRSDSFNLSSLDRKDTNARSFLLDPAPPARHETHRRDNSATPSSPILPIQDGRRSVSTRHTRSLVGDEEELIYNDNPQPRALPAPPTFKQFLSNRPSISQRPGLGGAMMSRFSWTNSNAPQTPHEASRDTVTQPVAGRDSFMTQRSSVPRFRTIDSWVNQQSTRVEEQRLKQQFRMTQSTTYSSEGESEEVPQLPAVPQTLSRVNSLPGRDIKHRRLDTNTTAPIFNQHPGTEVRFSVHSTVPSEVLDMGRKNAAL